MKVMRALVSLLTTAVVVTVMAQSALVANSQTVQIISASPGQAVSYQGHGSPGSQVTLEVSATVNADMLSNNHYMKTMNNVNIPGGSHFSVVASPVNTLTVSGSLGPFSTSIQGSVNGHTGSASMSNVPSGTYNIMISGISNGSGSVSLTVRASQPQSVRSDGTYTASISTSGMPSGVYSVKQNGQEVAKVYLGVTPPATPTPTATPTATPTVTPLPDNGTSPTPTVTVSPVPNASITPTPLPGNITPTAMPGNITPTPTPTPGSGGNTFFGIQLPSFNFLGGSPSATPTASASSQPSAQPSNSVNGSTATAIPAASQGGQDSLVQTIMIFIGAVIVGLIVGYVIVFVVLKK